MNNCYINTIRSSKFIDFIKTQNIKYDALRPGAMHIYIVKNSRGRVVYSYAAMFHTHENIRIACTFMFLCGIYKSNTQPFRLPEPSSSFSVLFINCKPASDTASNELQPKGKHSIYLPPLGHLYMYRKIYIEYTFKE